MDMMQQLADLQAKIAKGGATPQMIQDFLAQYGSKLDAIGMGGVVDKLGAQFDGLVKGGAGQQAQTPISDWDRFWLQLSQTLKMLPGTLKAIAAILGALVVLYGINTFRR